MSLSSYEVALALSIVLTAVSQLLLRSGARNRKGFLASFLHPKTISGYGLFLVVTLLTTYSMRVLHLRTVTAWSSLAYVIVPFSAAVFLKENLDRRTIAGSILIALGILVFSLEL